VTAVDAGTLLIAALLTGYLLAALLFPDRF
jgi:K+-transporting ATPase KdpF subunit